MRLTSSASSRVLLALAVVGDLAQAVRLSIHGRREQDTGLRRRGNVVGSSPLNNTGDVSYYTNITLGGSPFTVLIDTGRCVCTAELSCDAALKLISHCQLGFVGSRYGEGLAGHWQDKWGHVRCWRRQRCVRLPLRQRAYGKSHGGLKRKPGPIKTATLEFAGYTVQNQAFRALKACV